MSLPNTIHWKSLPGPEDIHRFELENGLVLLHRANFNSPSVVVSGYLPAGAQFDPPDRLSLASFTAVSLMRGNERHNHQELYDLLESSGASLGYGASVHNVSFGGRALAEDLPMLLGLINETLRTPTFPPDQLEKLRAQYLTSLAIRAHDTADQASLHFDRILFRDHPYARPEDGYPHTVRRIQRADLMDFHCRHFGPRGLVVVIVGAVTAGQALEEVQKALGDWQNPLQEPIPVMTGVGALRRTHRKHITVPGKVQTDLLIGTLGPRRSSPDFLAASLGNSVLGQFGMMGRIGDVVREQEGLAYSASTSLNSWIASGSWEVSAGVNPVNLERTIELVVRELERFTREPVSREELEDSQANYIGRLPLSLESNGGVAGALLSLERFQLGLDYFQRYPELIKSITPAQVLEVARRYIHPDRLAIVSAGPALKPAA